MGRRPMETLELSKKYMTKKTKSNLNKTIPRELTERKVLNGRSLTFTAYVGYYTIRDIFP